MRKIDLGVLVMIGLVGLSILSVDARIHRERSRDAIVLSPARDEIETSVFNYAFDGSYSFTWQIVGQHQATHHQRILHLVF